MAKPRAGKSKSPAGKSTPPAGKSTSPAGRSTEKSDGKSSGKARGHATFNAAFNAPLKPTPELAAAVGDAPLPRTEAVRKMWDYIEKHKLQDEKNRREIVADDNLRPNSGKDRATMFEMSGFLAQRLKSA